MASRCPFSRASQLHAGFDATEPECEHVPGHPRVKIKEPAELFNFLERDLYGAELERMAPWLWWMSKQDSANVSPLHRQRVKRRDIVLTEDPKLHLVWYHDRIFIKPLPKYLLSNTFWTRFVLADGAASSNHQRLRVHRSALGYLRTYFYLVQYESDFRIATDPGLGLVPAGVTWEQFCNFSANFTSIQDSDVTPRYAYGEIRLTRLNFYSKLLVRRCFFQRMESQYGDYFAQFYGPILFVFGILSVLLNAMQLGITVEQTGSLNTWLAFRSVSRWLSVVSLIGLAALIVGLAWLLFWKIFREWQFALTIRLRKRREKHVQHDTTLSNA